MSTAAVWFQRAACKQPPPTMSSRLKDSQGPLAASISLYKQTGFELTRSDVALLRTDGLSFCNENIIKEAVVDNGPSVGLRRSMTASARLSPSLSAPCASSHVPEAHTSRGGGELRPHRGWGLAYQTELPRYTRATEPVSDFEPMIAGGLLYAYQSVEFREMREHMICDNGFDAEDAVRAMTGIRISSDSATDVRLALTWLKQRGARQEQPERFPGVDDVPKVLFDPYATIGTK